MKNKLSHSSLSKFQDCPKAYDYHYNHKLRGTTMSAALLFGTAVDKAVEAMVKGKDNYIEVFDKLWEEQEINGKAIKLQTFPDIVYANNDFDIELLDTNLDPIYFNVDIINNVENMKKEIGFNNLQLGDKIFYNSINWFIAKKRGHLMLEAVKIEVIPKLKKVHSLQEKIDLSNESGDSVIGYTDMVADWETEGNTVVFDFKTSTRDYAEDSVLSSPQLALYVNALKEKYNTRKAGFIVLSKVIHKNRKKICKECGNDGSGKRHKTCDAMVKDAKGVRCNGEWEETIDPKAKVTVIIDEVPEQMEEMVIENAVTINHAIDAKVYVRNFSSCVKPYGKCVYFSLCHHKSMEGLVKNE